jgi:hypothetical protein
MTKKDRRPTPARSSAAARWGAALVVAAGLALVAVAGLLLLPRSAPAASRPSAGLTPAVTGAPRLSADKPKLDLGNVRLGQTVQAAFEITNQGDRPLQFTRAPYIEVVQGC